MKKIFRLLILYNIFLLYICFLQKSDYITDITSSKHFEKELKNSGKISGLILIYSTWCHHCKDFSYTYVKLAEKYHYQLFFYAMSDKTDYNKIFSDVIGYPTIFFYKNGNFTKNKASRSYESLSNIIEENYLKKCREIKYIEIKDIYTNKYLNEDKYRNLLIGFFQDEEYINIYDSITSSYLNKYIDFCYYCTDYEKYKNDSNNNINKYINDNIIIKDNLILSFNKIKRNNLFYLNNNDSFIKNDYFLFIHNNVINSYEDINKENKINLLELINDKLFLIFVYNSTEQKKTYEEIANKLYNMNSRKGKNVFNYFLFNKNATYKKFRTMKENSIYLIDENFKKFIELNNMDFIEELIKKNNMRLKKDVENLIKYIFDNNQISYLDAYSIYKYISLIIFIILLISYLFYKIFVKYIKSGKNTIYSEIMKNSDINTKIELV